MHFDKIQTKHLFENIPDLKRLKLISTRIIKSVALHRILKLWLRAPLVQEFEGALEHVTSVSNGERATGVYNAYAVGKQDTMYSWWLSCLRTLHSCQAFSLLQAEIQQLQWQ